MNSNSYKLGITSISFRKYTPEEILKAAKNAGLTCIEWGGDIYHAPYYEKDKIHKIAALQKQYKITCSSYGTYFRLGQTPNHELVEHINAAKILGTNVLRVWCGQKSGADMTNDERNFILTICKEAANIAKLHNAIICLECHRNTFTERPEDAVWLLNEVNSKHFLMYWQPFEWQTSEENIKNAKQIAPYTKHIHVFNWKNDKRFSLSDAIIEWQRYLKEFSNQHTLLLEFMPNDDLNELEKEANALKKIIGE